MERILSILFAVAVAMTTHAIEGLRISVVQSNVVLAWPSRTNETFIVQWRAAFDTNHPWLTLSTNHLAATDTNWTVFTHTNQLLYNTNISTMGGGGGGSGGPPPMLMSSSTASSTDAVKAKKVKMTELPPMPWDPATWAVPKTKPDKVGTATALNGLEPMGGGGSEGTNHTAGFYRVVRTGLSGFGLTNMALSGTQTFPVEIGTFGEPVTSVQVKANNADRPEFTYSTNEIGLMTWTWPTAFSPNGPYSLGIEGHLLNGGSVSNQLSATVTNDNAVTFPEWFSQIFSDDQMWIYAGTGTNAMTWKLHMYADGTNYLGYFAGSSPDGGINVVWNLAGPGGTKLTNEFYRGEFEIRQSGPGPMGNPPTTTFNWTMEKQWTDDSGFVLAFSKPSDAMNSEAAAETMVATAVMDTVHAANYALSPGNKPLGREIYRFHDNSSGFQLLQYLKDPSYRNFYYFGHGNGTSFGTVGTNATMRAWDIGSYLKNLTGVVTNNTSANKKPFRFVFIDGCSAGTPEMAQAFGIPGIQTDRAYFRLNNKVRSRAFLSFKDKVPFTPANWQQRSGMLLFFFDLWLQGRALNDCVRLTQERPGPFESKMPASAVIYGATNFSSRSP